MTKGIIFDIEEFAVHDGPGIRKTVFLKGCPLRCNWCHNPEGISFKKQMMVSKASCLQCGNCKKACQNSSCTVCGNCIAVCPLRLRKICGVEVEASELAKELLVGREILDQSGGGITISGGEPLAQPKFLLELIHALQSIHVAIETSGYTSCATFRSVVEKVDLVLMDIKHVDSHVHRQLTGVDNELILQNLKYLCSIDKRFIIRIPLIPGLTDTKDNMEKTSELLQGAKGLERVELLPYHKTAGAKYGMLGKEYKPIFDTEMQPQVHHEPFQRKHIRSVVL